MNKIFQSIPTVLLSASLIFCSSCETIINDPVVLQHDEKIVVEAFVVAGKPIDKILIEKTTGALDSLKPDITFIADAEVKVSVDGVSYKAVLKPDTTLYSLSTNPNQPRSAYAVPGLVAISGKTYLLEARWQGKIATAQTQIPRAVQLIRPLETRTTFDTVVNVNVARGTSVRTVFIEKNLRIKTAVISRKGEVYEPWVYAIQSRVPQTITYNSSTSSRNTRVFQPSHTAQTDELLLETTYTLYTFRSGSPDPNPLADSKFVYVVHSYDDVYYDYITTLSRARSGGGILGSNGFNPLWNIQGDGIGIFIGMTAKEFTISNP